MLLLSESYSFFFFFALPIRSIANKLFPTSMGVGEVKVVIFVFLSLFLGESYYFSRHYAKIL